MDELLGGDLENMMFNMRRLMLDNKPHIKKYNHYRKVHADILESMASYIFDGKYDFDKYISELNKDREVSSLENLKGFDFSSDDPDDVSIIAELFVYKNLKEVPSVTEIYLEKNKFKNADKVKLLKAMNESYVGLFKVTDIDFDNAYVTYEDVFTHKKFKVIDISMSAFSKVDDDNPIYMYNRVITVDGISFGTGIHCNLSYKNKEFRKFLEEHDYKKSTDFFRCLTLYEISKKEKNKRVRYNTQF